MSHGGGNSPFGVRHLQAIVDWLGNFGVNTGKVLAVVGLFLLVTLLLATNLSHNTILSFMIGTSPLWLPYLLFYLWFESWMFYIQTDSKLKLGRVSLEIMLPKEISKSPLAMENVLTQLYQKASPDNHFNTYWDGKHPPYFGLELVSTEGAVRFIVSTPAKKYKGYVEYAFYSQYPGIEIRELPVDYTAAVPWDPKTWGYMPIHFGKKKPNPLPIMTYIDFGLDKDPKDEFKHDPMSPMLELLGSLRPGEHLWFQFLIKIHREETFFTGSLSGTIPDWKPDIKAEIQKIYDEAKKRGQSDDEEEPNNRSPILTPLEKDTIEVLDRARTKFPFIVRIRVFYAAKLDSIDYDRVGQAITTFQATENPGRNAIGYKWRADYDWNMWQDPSGKKRLHLKQESLEMYKLRLYESMNHRDTTTIMTTEEIATLFHLPGANVTTPGLTRIPSARAEAPSNLPTA
jgi:hypothetical protein